MNKMDKSILDILHAKNNKFDGRLAGILSATEDTCALVRVHNPLHLGMLERNFDVTAVYPFIRSVGIRCTLETPYDWNACRK